MHQCIHIFLGKKIYMRERDRDLCMYTYMNEMINLICYHLYMHSL